MKLLSYSRLNTYTSCGKAFDYRYNQKLYPVPSFLTVERWQPRENGKLVHAGLEGHFRGGKVSDWVEKAAAELRTQNLSDEQQTALLEMQAESEKVANNVLAALPASDWEPLVHDGKLMVEYECITPLGVPGWDGFIGIMDMVARQRSTGQIWVVDWKTRKNFATEGTGVFNAQFAIYMHQLQEIGIKALGAKMVEIKPKAPTRGGEAIRITTIPLSPRYFNNIWEQVVVTKAKAMVEKPALAPNVSTFGCGWCDYRSLCQAELQDHDSKFIRENQFAPSNREPKVITLVE